MNGSNILLEAGTNELELMEFLVKDTSFGVNVMKIREVVNRPKVIKLPQAHPALEGVFSLREEVIPLLNLRQLFNYGANVNAALEKVIVMEINKLVVAFLVDSVSRIHRISWKGILPPPKITTDGTARVTGIASVSDKHIMLLDFESIVAEIAPTIIPPSVLSSSGDQRSQRAGKHIGLAEDSMLMRAKIVSLMQEAGYSKFKSFTNGLEAWTYLSNPESEKFDLFITDIEMPEMDGLFLTKSIKNDDRLKKLPVVIYSSMVSDENHAKTSAVGADGQITKPEIDSLISLLDKILKIP